MAYASRFGLFRVGHVAAGMERSYLERIRNSMQEPEGGGAILAFSQVKKVAVLNKGRGAR